MYVLAAIAASSLPENETLQRPALKCFLDADQGERLALGGAGTLTGVNRGPLTVNHPSNLEMF